jgi:hypothetical protein
VSSVCRIIVGASGSPGSLRALRYAQHLTRNLDTALVPVLSWLPPDGDLADRRTPCEELRGIWARDARQRLQDALTLAWGELPRRSAGPARPPARPARPGPCSTPPAVPVTCWWSEPADGAPAGSVRTTGKGAVTNTEYSHSWHRAWARGTRDTIATFGIGRPYVNFIGEAHRGQRPL